MDYDAFHICEQKKLDTSTGKVWFNINQFNLFKEELSSQPKVVFSEGELPVKCKVYVIIKDKFGN